MEIEIDNNSIFFDEPLSDEIDNDSNELRNGLPQEIISQYERSNIGTGNFPMLTNLNIIKLISTSANNMNKQWLQKIEKKISNLSSNELAENAEPIIFSLICSIGKLIDAKNNRSESNIKVFDSGVQIEITNDAIDLDDQIPYSIGYKMLKGNQEDKINDQTFQEFVEKATSNLKDPPIIVQQDDATIRLLLAKEQQQVKALKRKLNHWKYLAKFRRQQLDMEWEFKKRLIDNNQIQ